MYGKPKTVLISALLALPALLAGAPVATAGVATGAHAPIPSTLTRISSTSEGARPSAARGKRPRGPLSQRLPPVTISPLRGTPDASPSTQISFLGLPAASLSRIVVIGSRSGPHPGRLRAYASDAGASYVPARAFVRGETVTVGARVTVAGRHAAIGTTFTVGSPYRISVDGPQLFPALADTVINLTSRPDLHPPTVAISVPAADPALGDLFVTPVYGDSQAGPMIVSPTGKLVWFAPEPVGYLAANLRVQRYLGRRVLTYWHGRIALGHGIGEGVIRNAHYQEIATVRAGNGLTMDMHDFTLAPGGAAYITVYDPVRRNLSAVGGPVNGVLFDSVVQEIDVRTGLVMFEWHALGHVPLRASHSTPLPDPTAAYDWFHINAIQALTDGNLLVNARNTWATYKVSHRTGAILWQLGGRHSSFRLGLHVPFAYQHNATLLPDGTVQIFDNEAAPQVGANSRAIVVKLNFKAHSATLLHSYVDARRPVLTASQGDVQALRNGDKLIGFGEVGLVSEVSAAGRPTFEMELPPYVQSYRAYRFRWAATPAGKPTVAASRSVTETTTAVAASWNGATTVSAWQVLAGTSPAKLRPVGRPAASSGFESQLAAATTAPYVAAEALGAGGAVLATSAAVAVATPAG